MEKVRATRAALYLLDSSGGYRLAASFGFGRTDRLPELLQRTHPIPVTVFERREPYVVNDVREAGKLVGAMEATSSTRLLVAPLYLDGRIVGLLDVRDKAGREPFTNEDLPWVLEVLRRLAERVRSLPFYAAAGPTPGLVPETSPFDQTGPVAVRRPGADAGVLILESGRSPDAPPPATTQPVVPVGPRIGPLPAPPPPLQELSADHLPTATLRLQRLVDETLAAAAGRRLPPLPAAVRETPVQRLFLEAALLFPDVVGSALTFVEPSALATTVASRRPLAADAEAALAENVERIFAKAGARFGLPAARSATPLEAAGARGEPLPRADVAAIQSSVLWAGPEQVAILSLVFRHGPGADSRDALKSVHLLAKSALGEVQAAARYREAFRGLVNKLVEPGLRRYPALKAHSYNVGRMSRRFATSLGMSAQEVEQVTVAGILHDVGLRDLNYEELYAKRSLTEDELKLLREHPRVGAHVLEDVPWPYPVAPLVRHHHERWDGAGYPDGLRGEEIPVGSRIVHLCEAFDAMTSSTSYRSVLTPAQALEVIVGKRGTQFDPELALAFRKLVQGVRPDGGAGA